MICCNCHKEITKTYGRVTDLGNYCKECAKQNEVEAAKLFESNMKNVLEIEKRNAVKEFAEELKAKAHSVVGFNVRKRVYAKEYTINEIDIDEILKEYINGEKTH